MTILADFAISDEDMPPYRQVRRAIAQDIREGKIAVGTKLPTVRALATQLALATNTVARAYKELEELGGDHRAPRRWPCISETRVQCIMVRALSRRRRAEPRSRPRPRPRGLAFQ